MLNRTAHFVLVSLLFLLLVACGEPATTPPGSASDIDAPPAEVEAQAVSPDEPRPDEVELAADPPPTEPPSDPSIPAEPELIDEVEEAVAPPTEAAPPLVGAVVYETDFSSGWPEINSEIGNESMVEGGYQIDTQQAMWTYTTRMSMTAFYAEITASAQECPENTGAFGLAFNYINDEDLKAFVVTCSGSWQVFEKRSASVAQTIAEGGIPFDIDPSSELSVGVLGDGATFELFVNNVSVGTVEIDEAPAGDFGPYAQTVTDERPISVLFSSLTVYELPS